MKKWVCTVCGYVYEGEQAPEKCPQCGVPASKFKLQESEGMAWACEHEVGAVSYTHLDVYKRQTMSRRNSRLTPATAPVTARIRFRLKWSRHT